MDAGWKARIEEQLSALDAEDALGRRGQATVALDQQAVGRLSRQDALLNQSMARATQARRAARRRALHAALKRLEDGEFGHCVDCGEVIAEKRLALEVTVLRCLDCARG
jgi:DnaK suppressor protein